MANVPVVAEVAQVAEVPVVEEVVAERPKIEPPPIPTELTEEAVIEPEVSLPQPKVKTEPEIEEVTVVESKKEIEAVTEKRVESVVSIQTNGEVKAEVVSPKQAELVKEEIPENPDPPRRKRNKFCQCC